VPEKCDHNCHDVTHWWKQNAVTQCVSR